MKIVNRLVFRIYLAVIASLLLFFVSTVILAGILSGVERARQGEQVAAVFSQNIAPVLVRKGFIDRGDKRALRAFARDFRADIIITDRQDKPLFRTGRPFSHNPSPLKDLLARIGGNRPLVINFGRLRAYILVNDAFVTPQSLGLRFFGGLLLLFLCVGAIAYPLANRVTRRLELLNTEVDNWGQSSGDKPLNLSKNTLASQDEIGALASSFQSASDKIHTLMQANKLLLANASHEIRTPLTRIRLNMEMLDGLIDDSKRATFNSRKTSIKRNLTELDDLIDSILQSSRLDAQEGLVNAEMVDLYQLIQQEQQHYVDLELTGETVFVCGQQNLLNQMVRNLIGNAYKHGKPPVKVSVYKKDRTTKMPQGNIKNGKAAQAVAVLSVTDTGEGIPVDKFDDIFKPFKRLSSKTKGNGLGLHLVKKIVELHGGEIGVTSGAQGTCFEVNLPSANHQSPTEPN